MTKPAQDFQVFAKPTGPLCNLACEYCYYLEKESLYPQTRFFTMPDGVLEAHIQQVINTSVEPEIRFSWHGGEPTLLGVDYFKKITDLQKKHNTQHRTIVNNIQTNGTLINPAWCDFLAKEKFTVGLSMDGPEEFHDAHRLTKGKTPTHRSVLQAWELLTRYGIITDILCVVHAGNVFHPLAVYRFFKQINARYMGFLPIVKQDPDGETGVSAQTVPAKAFGEFLAVIFDEWKTRDIGNVLVQLFEEVARTALGQEHSLCIFRKTCGNVPVVEHNGDVYSCDHFVRPNFRLGNLLETPMAKLMETSAQRAFGQSKQTLLPRTCRTCAVLKFCNGGCPKDRFVVAGPGSEKQNYLCEGYQLFFNHCLPFAHALDQAFRNKASGRTGSPRPAEPGRNDPCPCGSGKKYKKCCMQQPLSF